MHKYTSQVKSKQASSAYSQASPVTCVNLVSVKFALSPLSLLTTEQHNTNFVKLFMVSKERNATEL